MVYSTHLVLSAQLRQYLGHIGEPPQLLVSPVPIHNHPLHLCSTHCTCVIEYSLTNCRFTIQLKTANMNLALFSDFLERGGGYHEQYLCQEAV